MIMINEFIYGQTWKNWPSPLSLSLYSAFKSFSALSSSFHYHKYNNETNFIIPFKI